MKRLTNKNTPSSRENSRSSGDDSNDDSLKRSVVRSTHKIGRRGRRNPCVFSGSDSESVSSRSVSLSADRNRRSGSESSQSRSGSQSKLLKGNGQSLRLRSRNRLRLKNNEQKQKKNRSSNERKKQRSRSKKRERKSTPTDSGQVHRARSVTSVQSQSRPGFSRQRLVSHFWKVCGDITKSIKSEESSLSIITQVSLPFIIAGYGTVGAGMVLDIVQHWDVFRMVGEIFILVPALLGLKGNLEMTLASRLSTQANLGHMDSRKEMIKMVAGNMALIQAQAIVVGFLSSLTAMVMGWIKNGEFIIDHALLLCASSLFTASIASFVLGSIMVLVVLGSRFCSINPDNVATPIAASLGDLVTLSLLSWVGNLLWEAIGKQHWLAPVIITLFLLLLPLWVTICIRNKYTNDVIYSGWTPVLSAMVISSISGLILDFAVAFYHGIAVFQPVINGVGGNLVAVHASRMSTTLHQKGHPGQRIRDPKLKGFLNPFKVFFGSSVHSRASRVLTFLTIPGHLVFIYTISYMNAGHTSLSVLFNVIYLTAALLQVMILIYVATWMVPMIWVSGSDPDNVAIPYLTALGDLLGTGFLALAFHLLFLMGDRDADVGD